MVESVTLVTLMGLSLGSFLNVYAYRLPRGISVVRLRSFCPICGTQLKWYELIPVASFFLNSGRCGFCKQPISKTYLFIEIIFGILAVTFFMLHGFTVQLLLSATFAFLMLLIAVIDYKHLIIPNKLVVISLLAGTALQALISPAELLSGVLSAVSSFLLTFGVLLAGNWMFKKESLGMGDVKLSAVVGLFLGFEGFLVTLWIASVTGLLFAWFVKGTFTKDSKLPFGAFLAVSSILVMMLKEKFLEVVALW